MLEAVVDIRGLLILWWITGRRGYWGADFCHSAWCVTCTSACMHPRFYFTPCRWSFCVVGAETNPWGSVILHFVWSAVVGGPVLSPALKIQHNINKAASEGSCYWILLREDLFFYSPLWPEAAELCYLYMKQGARLLDDDGFITDYSADRLIQPLFCCQLSVMELYFFFFHHFEVWCVKSGRGGWFTLALLI